MSATVIDVKRLKSCLQKLRRSRHDEVIDVLNYSPGDFSVPNVVTIHSGGCTVRLFLSDLLLSTSPGRFHLDALKQCQTLNVPSEAEDHIAGPALLIVAQLFANVAPSVPAQSVPSVIRLCNFLGAEQILDGIYSSLKLDRLDGYELIHLLESLAAYTLGNLDTVFPAALHVLQNSSDMQEALGKQENWKHLLPLAHHLTSGVILLPKATTWLQSLDPVHGPLAMLLHFSLLVSMSEVFTSVCLKAPKDSKTTVRCSISPSDDIHSIRSSGAAVLHSAESDSDSDTTVPDTADALHLISRRHAALQQRNNRASECGSSVDRYSCGAASILSDASAEVSSGSEALASSEDVRARHASRDVATSTQADECSWEVCENAQEIKSAFAVRTLILHLSSTVMAWLKADPQAVSDSCITTMAQHAVQSVIAEHALIQKAGSLSGCATDVKGPAQFAIDSITQGLISTRYGAKDCHSLPVQPRWDGHKLAKEWRPSGIALKRNGKDILRAVMLWTRPAMTCFLLHKSQPVSYWVGNKKLQLRLQNEAHPDGGSSMFVSLSTTLYNLEEQFCSVTIYAVNADQLTSVVEPRPPRSNSCYYLSDFRMMCGLTLGVTPWVKLEDLQRDFPSEIYVCVDVELD